MSGNSWHKLKPNHGTEGPENVVSVYCHMQPSGGYDEYGFPIGEYNFTCGYAYGIRRKNGKWYGRKELGFTNTEVFWAWLQQWPRKKSPVWVYSYNFSEQSQILGMFKQLDSGKLKLHIDPNDRAASGLSKVKENKPWKGLCIIEDRPFIVIAVCPSGTVKFCDIRNYLDMSEQQLMKVDCIQPDSTVLSSAESAGNIASCQSLSWTILNIATGLMDYWKANNLGTWQPTIGRLAMSNYRHKHLDDRIVIHKPKISKENSGSKAKWMEEVKDQPEWKAKLLERDAYMGGEIRHWYNGGSGEEVFHIDRTSHYASVMDRYDFPYKLRFYFEGEFTDEVFKKHNPRECIAEIVLDTFQDRYPYRVKRGIRFPVGRFATVLCGKELSIAYESGCIKAVHRIANYHCGTILRNYARHWIHEKRQSDLIGNSLGRNLSKAMLVSLPGKFGSLGNRWEMRDSQTYPERWGEWVQWDEKEGKLCRFKSVAGNALCECERGERLDTMVAIAAFTTMYGRCDIYDFRLTFPYRSVYLQQTDSLITNSEGYEHARRQEGFNSGEAGTWSDRGHYNGIYIWNANFWQAGEGGKVQSESGCTSGLTWPNRETGASEWIVRTKENAGNAIKFGPSGSIATGTKRFRLAEMTGNYGQWGPGWNDGPISLGELDNVRNCGPIDDPYNNVDNASGSDLLLCQNLLFAT